MKDLFRLLFGVIGIIIGSILCIGLAVFGSFILWPIYILISIIQCLWRFIDKNTDWSNTFIEFIFAYYGFCALFLYLSIDVFFED